MKTYGYQYPMLELSSKYRIDFLAAASYYKPTISKLALPVLHKKSLANGQIDVEINYQQECYQNNTYATVILHKNWNKR